MSASAETTVSIHPYFKVHEGKLEAARAHLPEMAAQTSAEEACLYYDFFVNGEVITCREAYEGAAGFLAHLDNIGEKLGRLLEMSDLVRIEVQGPAGELDKLREPLADLQVEWFAFECGVEKQGPA
jgi:quinol monooxygenase YgiN